MTSIVGPIIALVVVVVIIVVVASLTGSF